jgi:hypothetical protein
MRRLTLMKIFGALSNNSPTVTFGDSNRACPRWTVRLGVFLSYDSKPLRVFPNDFIHACFDPLHVNAFSTSLMETDSLSQKVDCLRPTTPNGAFFVQLDRFRIDGDVAERLQARCDVLPFGASETAAAGRDVGTLE